MKDMSSAGLNFYNSNILFQTINKLGAHVGSYLLCNQKLDSPSIYQ